jgi:hypothetical protein
MKKLFFCLIVFVLIISACELEGGAVIGPGGGIVFYDKGKSDTKESHDPTNTKKWRYKECSNENIRGEFDSKPSEDKIKEIIDQYDKDNDVSGWRLPTADEVVLMKKAYLTLTFYNIINEDDKGYENKKYVIRAVKEF